MFIINLIIITLNNLIKKNNKNTNKNNYNNIYKMILIFIFKHIDKYKY